MQTVGDVNVFYVIWSLVFWFFSLTQYKMTLGPRLFCTQKGEHFSEKPLSTDVSHENILHMSQYKVLKHISVMIKSFVINKYSQAFIFEIR